MSDTFKKQLADNQSHNKPLKFVMVGIFNTVLDFGILNILRLLGMPLIIANTISTGTAMLCSFFLNKKWTFKRDSKNYLREIYLFFLFTIIGIWVIQNGVMYLIVQHIPHFGVNQHLFENIAKLAASIPSLMWNYFTYDKFVFKNKKSKNN